MTPRTPPPNATEPAHDLPAPELVAPHPALRGSILAAAAAKPAATRRSMFRESLALVTSSWLVAFAVFWFAGGPRVTGRPFALMLGTAVGTASVAAITVWIALVRGRSTLGRSLHIVVPTALGSVPALLAWKVWWSLRFPGALDEWPTRPGLRCLGLSLSIAMLPLLAFVVARRRSDPQRPGLAGFAAGVAIGCVTTLFTDLWCPVAFIPHLLLGHALPIALLGALGAILGQRYMRLPAQTARGQIPLP